VDSKFKQRSLAIARLAKFVCRGTLPEYSCPKSPKKYQQPQLLAILVLKTYFRTTYRGIIELLELSPELREALDLKKIPDFSALQKFGERAVDEKLLNSLLRRLVKQVGKNPEAVAMDSTELDSTEASMHFLSRTGKRKQKINIKLGVIIMCGSLIPCAVAVGQGPSNDRIEAPRLLECAAQTCSPKMLFADAGYDAEWIHEFCYEEWQTESYIPPHRFTKDKKIASGFYRAQMLALPPEYSKRQHVESFMSGLKRMTSSRLRARLRGNQIIEALLKVLTYGLFR